MEANLKLKTRLRCPSKEAKPWPDARKGGEAEGWEIQSGRPEEEGSEQKARGRAWSDFLSLRASQAPGSYHKMPLTTLRGGRQAGRDGRREAFKGPGEARVLMPGKEQTKFSWRLPSEYSGASCVLFVNMNMDPFI